MATKQNKQQTALLERDDLEATYACLKSWEEGSEEPGLRRLFAFFNSGDHSGASQPHRHVQFLPVEEMARGEKPGRWKLLIDLIEECGISRDQSSSKRFVGLYSTLLTSYTGITDLKSHPALPFAQYGRSLHPTISASELYETYIRLYQVAEAAVCNYIQNHPGSLNLHPTEGGSNPISYNLALTTSFMAICPRRQEGELLRRSDGSEIGSVALNGTLLAGTLMVKGVGEWETLKTSKSSFDGILEAAGIPQSAIDSQSEHNKL